MHPDPFPAPGPDNGEPDGSGPLPADGDGTAASGQRPVDNRDAGAAIGSPAGPASFPPGGPEQGLFVCLPAEDLDVARFAQHGTSDAMPPGPLLAEIVHALAGEDGDGLAALSEDQLVGIIAATRRLESRIAWTQLAALREFAARRAAGQGSGRAEFVADELACELHLTAQSAADQLAYASAVAGRLPRTFAALAAGTIHPVHARIVEDETSILSPEHAAEADAQLARKAGSLTFGQLRSLAHRLVLKLDPEAARKRKEAARREAHVRRFAEDSGNAGMVARELPPDEVLASWQHVERRALDLRAAGLPGTLRELRIRAYLDLLQERDSRAAPDGPQDGQEGSGPQPAEVLAALRLTLRPGDPRPVRPRPGRGPLPARPQAAAPGQCPQCPVYRAGLRAARGPLRPGSYDSLAPRRPHMSL